MANTRVGNVIHIDSTGAVLDTLNTKVTSIFLTSNAAGDTVVLREASSGSDKLTLKNGIASSTIQFNLEDSPILFSQGIYVQSISSSAKLMLVLSQAGRS